MIKTTLPMLGKGKILSVGFLLMNGRGGSVRGNFLWDTGATKTTIPWKDLKGLRLNEDEVFSQKKVVIGETANGVMIHGYKVNIPRTILHRFGTFEQFAEIEHLTIYTSREHNLSLLLGTDVTRLFNHCWKNDKSLVEVELREDWQTDIDCRDNTDYWPSYYGFHIKSLL